MSARRPMREAAKAFLRWRAAASRDIHINNYDERRRREFFCIGSLSSPVDLAFEINGSRALPVFR